MAFIEIVEGSNLLGQIVVHLASMLLEMTQIVIHNSLKICNESN